MRFFFIKVAFGLTVLLIAAMPLRSTYAQAAPISASVDRTEISTDETLTLTVVVDSHMGTHLPTLPSLDGFLVVQRGSTSRMSIVFGVVSGSTTFEFRLRPTRTGNLTIGPVSIVLDGKRYATDPIEIKVTQGSGSVGSLPGDLDLPVQSSQLSGQDLFVEAEVNNSNPYVGEQVVYVFRHYRATGSNFRSVFGTVNYVPPSFDGFWKLQDSEERRYDLQAAGREYRVTEDRRVIFPTRAGPVTINASRLRVFGRFFQRDVPLETMPVALEVRPLPEGAPRGFAGAVGRFTITAKVDLSRGRVGEPVTLSVTLTGEGNIDALPEPDWPALTHWRAFDSTVTVNTRLSDGIVQGSRVYERVLVPSKAGELTIPPTDYTFFDPTSAVYVTISTDPITVDIAAGIGVAGGPAFGDDVRAPVERLAADIRHIKPVPSALRKPSRPLTSRSGYWAAWTLPLAALVASVAWQRGRRRLEADSGLARRLHAFRNATRALARPDGSESDPGAALGHVLTTYIGDKLDQPVAGLTHAALGELLAAGEVASELVERVMSCLSASDMGRYAPASRSPGDEGLTESIERVISDLERVLEK